MTIRQLTTPWAPGSSLYSVPGNLILKLALGEAPESVPSRRDVRRRIAQPATSFDGGPIDRIVRHWGGEARYTRIHSAALALRESARRDVRFDDIEHVTGVARTFRVEMSRHAALGVLAEALRQLVSVESVSLNYVTAVPLEAPGLNDDLAWSVRDMIHAPEALAYEPGDAAVIVGLVDSGIVPDHPELEGRLRGGFDCVHLGPADLAGGMQYLGDVNVIDTNPIDQYVGHGMCCAGIIGALGEFIPPGLAGNSQLLPVRVLGAARMPGRSRAIGIGAIADIDTGLKMAVDLGAKVLNLSFGTPDEMLDPAASKPHAEVIRYALARGAIPVAASGNSGNDEKFWPAAFDGVIAVGSVAASGEPSNFTTAGSHVALCAPGERIVTTALAGYELATGTSFAAPFVAAAAALLVSRAERRSLPIDSQLVRAVLCTSATPFAAPVSGYGRGVLNAYAALQALDQIIDTAPPGGAGKGEHELAA
jgi:subtilisin family serine protease